MRALPQRIGQRGVLAGAILMAESALEKALAAVEGESGQRGLHRTLRWTQPCVRQAACRESKKWARSGLQTGAPKTQNSPENAARERTRVRNLRQAFQSLQAALPSVPPDTKLSKLDVLVLATNYIAHLTEMLDQGGSLCDHPALQRAEGYLHPVKKWPMRSLLYCGNIAERLPGACSEQQESLPPHQSVQLRSEQTKAAELT